MLAKKVATMSNVSIVGLFPMFLILSESAVSIAIVIMTATTAASGISESRFFANIMMNSMNIPVDSVESLLFTIFVIHNRLAD